MRRTFVPVVIHFACAAVLGMACGGTADRDPTIGTAIDTDRPVVPTSPATGVRLAVAETSEDAAYLTDSRGKPLYARVNTQQPCDAICEQTWPPVGATDPPPEAAMPAVQPSLTGTTLRDDGRLQVTYAGKPLHYNNHDVRPIRPGISDRWGEWSVVSPQGDLVAGRNGGPQQPSLQAAPLPVGRIIEDASAFAGQHLTVRGQVADVWSSQAFTVVSQQFLANDALLVLTRGPVPPDGDGVSVGERGRRVEITGTVRTGSIEALADELNLTLPDRVRSAAQSRGVALVADRVDVAEFR